jgi:hypothetical protein
LELDAPALFEARERWHAPPDLLFEAKGRGGPPMEIRFSPKRRFLIAAFWLLITAALLFELYYLPM